MAGWSRAAGVLMQDLTPAMCSGRHCAVLRFPSVVSRDYAVASADYLNLNAPVSTNPSRSFPVLPIAVNKGHSHISTLQESGHFYLALT
jgi:hypothetical protein